jgi:hypothetical protein
MQIHHIWRVTDRWMLLSYLQYNYCFWEGGGVEKSDNWPDRAGTDQTRPDVCIDWTVDRVANVWKSENCSNWRPLQHWNWQKHKQSTATL